MESLDIPERVRKVLREAVKNIERVLGETEIYLFGSYARGDWLEDSDIDLIIVSPRFRGMSMGERYRIVRELIPGTVSVELLLYTPEEFERVRRKSIVIKDAQEYWIKLK